MYMILTGQSQQDELHRIKANGINQVDSSGGHSAAWIRRSMILLKSTLNHPMTLPHVDEDGDEEMEIDEEAVEKLCIQVEKQSDFNKANNMIDVSKDGVKSDSQLEVSEYGSGGECVKDQDCEDSDVNMEEGISEHDEAMIVDCEEPINRVPDCSSDNVPICNNVKEKNDQEICTLNGISPGIPAQDRNDFSSSASKKLNEEESLSKTLQDDASCLNSEPDIEVSACISASDGCNGSPDGLINCASPGLSIVPSNVSPVLKSPTPSVSPKINTSRKSLRTSSMLTASQKDLLDDSKLTPEAVHISLAKSLKRRSSSAFSTQTSKNHPAPTQQLAASIRHGLEIIDNHRQSTALRRSAFRFSFKPTESIPILPVSKVDAGVQTMHETQQEESGEFMCTSCKSRMQLEVKEANDTSNMQLVPLDGSEPADKLKKQIPKVSSEVSALFLLNDPDCSQRYVRIF